MTGSKSVPGPAEETVRDCAQPDWRRRGWKATEPNARAEGTISPLANRRALTAASGGGAGIIALFEALEDLFELVHARVGEEQGGVVGGDQVTGADDAMIAGVEEVEKALADVVTGHRSPLRSGDSFIIGGAVVGANFSGSGAFPRLPQGFPRRPEGLKRLPSGSVFWEILLESITSQVRFDKKTFCRFFGRAPVGFGGDLSG